ncbi:hypothetical protein WJX73_007014 [Symbiochloris irregularis]|uniref:GrpE protein homolog n=1 Tax=Symbiochloris irregularis TaxID=706552 RepID=A0AAW1P463_9CHLO
MEVSGPLSEQPSVLIRHSRAFHSLITRVGRPLRPTAKAKPPPPGPRGKSAAPDSDELAEAASAESVAEDVEVLSDDELADELQELRARASAAEASLQAAEDATQLQKDKFLRLNADWENYRKRTAAEQTRARTDAKGDVVKQLLPLVDSFELARGQLQPQTDGELKIDSAYQGVYKQMVDLMKAIGVVPVPGEGQPFDPNVHDAIMREPSEEVPDSTVLQVLRRGFTIGEKLLRPAMVKVSFSEAPAAPAASASGNGAAAAAAAAATADVADEVKDAAMDS